MGDPTGCKSPATWKSYAYDSRRAKGMGLYSYTLAVSCTKTNYRYVKYTCCPSSTY